MDDFGCAHGGGLRVLGEFYGVRVLRYWFWHRAFSIFTAWLLRLPVSGYYECCVATFRPSAMKIAPMIFPCQRLSQRKRLATRPSGRMVSASSDVSAAPIGRKDGVE